MPRVRSTERALEDSAAFKRRRLLAAVVIAVLIAVPVYMLFLRDKGGKHTLPESPLLNAAANPADANKVLVHQVRDRLQGITVRYPNGWTGQIAGPSVRVASKDKSAAIGILSKGSPARAPAVFREAVKGVAAGFTASAKIRFIPAREQKPIAGLPSAGAAITGQLKSGGARTLLVAVARGKKRSYVVTVVAPPSGGQLGTANLILARGLTLRG